MYIIKQLVVLDRVESVINQVGSKSTLGQTLRHIRGKREQLQYKQNPVNMTKGDIYVRYCLD